MSRPLDIAVVGAGIAGMACAIALRQLGHRIHHYERRAADAHGGGGLLLQPSTLSLLDNLGVGAEVRAIGARVSQVHAETRSGRPLMSLSYGNPAQGRTGLGIQRDALVALLRASAPAGLALSFLRRVASIDAVRGYLHRVDGTADGPFDLIVVASGAGSSLRRSIPGLVRVDRLYPWAALVCCLDDSEGFSAGRLLQVFDGARHVSVWPVAAKRGSAPRRLNISVAVALAGAEALRQSGEWRDAVAHFGPGLRSLVDGLDVEHKPAIYRCRDVVLRDAGAGRAVFIGDAAHSMSPLLGQGVRMALLDGTVLAASVDRYSDPRLAMHEYAQQRHTQLKRYQRLSRWLTPWVHSRNTAVAALRDAALFPLTRVPYVKRRMRDILFS